MTSTKALALAVLLVVAASVVDAALYAPDSAVTNITDSMWQNVIESEEMWVIEFYAPWCGHCQALAPHYEKVAANLKGIVNVGAVDCEANPQIAKAMQVKGYPSIRFMPAEKSYNAYTGQVQKLVSEYQGAATAKDIIAAALKVQPSRVAVVNTANSQEFLEDDYPKVLLFSQKSEISSLYKSLSWNFRERLRFGQASDTDTELVKLFGVKTFPHVVVIPGDDTSKAIAHEGAIKREELTAFLDKHALAEKTVDPGAPERKKLIVRIHTAEEFQEKVMGDKEQPWLVLFDKGKTHHAALTSIASSISPFVNVAVVDASKSTAIATSQEVTKFPTLRLYQVDKSDVDDCPQPEKGQNAMQKWVDEKLLGFVSNIQVGEPLNAFLKKCLDGQCVFYFGKEAEPPLYFRMISIKYHKDLHFAMLSNPAPAVLAQFGIQGSLPRVLVFFSPNGTMESLSALTYTGKMDVQELSGFCNGLIKKEGDEPKKASDRALQALKEITAENPFTKVCSGAGLCAVAFFDGSNEEAKAKSIAVLEAVRKKSSASPFRFAWVDAICQHDAAANFDVTVDKLPTLVVISAAKMRQRQLMGVFDVETVSNFLDGVVSGKFGTSPFSRLPDMNTSDKCEALHEEYRKANEVAPESEEIDPIMAEVIAAAKAREEEERKLRKSSGGDDDDDEDDEPKKKKKKKSKKSKK